MENSTIEIPLARLSGISCLSVLKAVPKHDCISNVNHSTFCNRYIVTTMEGSAPYGCVMLNSIMLNSIMRNEADP